MTIAIDIFSVWNLIQFLDLFGTMAFAVTGAIKAVEHRLDIFGVIVLAAITGLAGGIIRDATRENPTFWNLRTLICKHCDSHGCFRFLSIS